MWSVGNLKDVWVAIHPTTNSLWEGLTLFRALWTFSAAFLEQVSRQPADAAGWLAFGRGESPAATAEKVDGLSWTTVSARASIKKSVVSFMAAAVSSFTESKWLVSDFACHPLCNTWPDC